MKIGRYGAAVDINCFQRRFERVTVIARLPRSSRTASSRSGIISATGVAGPRFHEALAEKRPYIGPSPYIGCLRLSAAYTC